MTTLKEQLQLDIKDAMKARNKQKLDVLRLISAAVKQIEVDERIDVDDHRILIILDKMVKQRNESISHYQAASRDDLIAQETFELEIIKHYMPSALTDTEIETLISDAFASIQIKSASDMGQIMSFLKPKMQGRADMSQVSSLVKAKLTEILG